MPFPVTPHEKRVLAVVGLLIVVGLILFALS